MFEFIKDIRVCIDKIDKIADNKRFATNPFSKIVNQTYVWTEKNSCFNSIIRKK